MGNDLLELFGIMKALFQFIINCLGYTYGLFPFIVTAAIGTFFTVVIVIFVLKFIIAITNIATGMVRGILSLVGMG